MELQGKPFAVRIDGYLEATRFYPVTLNEDIPFDLQSLCPCCESALTPMCTFTSESETKVIRWGVCGKCGHMTYIDRPQQSWMVEFYRHQWDRFPKSPETIRESLALPKEGRKGSRYIMYSLVENLPVDKSRPVCEIGSGYGEVLKNLQLAGFQKVIGVENSSHRAQNVTAAFGISVLHGDFEGERVQSALAVQGPVAVFYSHHVLEHTYHPSQIVQAISRNQKEGDYLIFAVPNAEGEHINLALFFLAHMHSFTRMSLESLLNRFGYQVVQDASPDKTNLFLVAQKTSNPVPHFREVKDWCAEVMSRAQRVFKLPEMKPGRPFELRWQDCVEDFDYTEANPRSDGWMGNVGWRLKKAWLETKAHRLRRFKGYHLMRVHCPVERRTLQNESPLEFRFRGPIQLLLK